ncbi:hypothetical protein ACFE04_017930 [Oxalis oulophora]
MSLSKNLLQSSDTNQSKSTSLNPNAAEFIPFSLRSSPGPVNKSASFNHTASLGKSVLTRVESSVSNTSDDEAHQFWRHQLPDDITPDFKFMNDDVSQGIGNLSLSGLSLHSSNRVSTFSPSSGKSHLFTDHQELSPQHINRSSFAEKSRHHIPTSSYNDNPATTSFLHLHSKPWDKQVTNSDLYDVNSSHGFMHEILGEQAIMDDPEMNPVEFLASQFPGFAAESLAEVYIANGCDLNLTSEMLTQLELQVDGDFNHNLNSNTLSAPSLTSLDFPALNVSDGENDLQSGSLFRPSDEDHKLLYTTYGPSRSIADFADFARKLASQDSGMWKYERNGSADSSVGSSRSSHALSSAYSGHGRNPYADRLQNHGSARTAPVWLETGDAVANMYSELREEARDHARLRNAYYEQARQAYLIGNKALAKELSAKGQLYGAHMKAAHGKAQEAIFRQRNPVTPELHGNGRSQERMIDLHGLHVAEAIHVLKHELSVLRSTVRSADQRLQVYICVGTGHHTRGSRTPARLPVAIQRYLLEEEGLEYTEPQPGLLRVVIY